MPQLARDDGGAGAFWMALEDAVAAFGAALAVRIFGEGWQAMGCEASWRADSAGGMPTEASWCDLARSPPGMRRLAPPPSGLLHLGRISDAHAPSCSGRAPARCDNPQFFVGLAGPARGKNDETATFYAILSQVRCLPPDDSPQLNRFFAASQRCSPPLAHAHLVAA